MRCMHQNCDKPASVHITTKEDGQVSSVHLCQEHGKLEQYAFIQGPMASPAALLSKIVGGAQGGESDEVCERCDMSWLHFLQGGGRLGCAEDYRVFEKNLGAVIQQTQHDAAHTGKVPVRAFAHLARERNLDQLRQSLDEAVEREDFETAAHLRDRIAALEDRPAEEG